MPGCPRKTCVVGLGGEFGDDRAGWCVVARLRELLAPQASSSIELKMAATPADLLQVDIQTDKLIVIDACQGLGRCGDRLRVSWPSPLVQHTRHACGHNLSVADALQTVSALGQLPAVCELWCIEGRGFALHEPLSPEVQAAVEDVAQQIFAILS